MCTCVEDIILDIILNMKESPCLNANRSIGRERMFQRLLKIIGFKSDSTSTITIETSQRDMEIIINREGYIIRVKEISFRCLDLLGVCQREWEI